MKLLLVVVLIPMVLGNALEKREFLGGLSSLLNLDLIRTGVTQIVHLVGADPSEQACERACHSIVMGDETALLHTFCSPMCHSFQALIQHFDITPTEATVGKRANFFEGLIDTTALKTGLQQLIDLLGTDHSEKNCEGRCDQVVVGGETALLHTFCPAICRSLQTLIQTFHLVPAKRLLEDN